jgi:hypothetical protein
MLHVALLSVAWAQDPAEGEVPEAPDLSLVPAWTLPVDPATVEPEPEVDPDDPLTQRTTSLVNVPGLPVDVAIPDPLIGEMPVWSFRALDSTSEVRLAMRNAELFTNVQWSAIPFQVDLTSVDLELMSEDLGLNEDVTDMDMVQTLGEWQSADHPELGPVLYMNLHVLDTFMDRPLYGHILVFSVSGGTAIVTTQSSMDLATAQLVLADVVTMSEVTEPAKSFEEQGLVGRLDHEAGFSLTVPEGMRALSVEEMDISPPRLAGNGPYGGAESELLLIETRRPVPNRALYCWATTEAQLEILPAEKSQESVQNFREWANALGRGGSVRIETSGEEVFLDHAENTWMPFHAAEGELGSVELLPMDHRDAYLYRVPGEVYTEDHDARFFYTTYADVGLTCWVLAGPEDPSLIDDFDQAMKGLEITDGAAHPMYLTTRGRYKRWWPTGNPFLQLYWAPIPILLIAGWLVLRD